LSNILPIKQDAKNEKVYYQHFVDNSITKASSIIIICNFSLPLQGVSRMRRMDSSFQCCIKDGSRPTDYVVQMKYPNHLKMLCSKGMVLNVQEKGVCKRHQVRVRKLNKSGPTEGFCLCRCSSPANNSCTNAVGEEHSQRHKEHQQRNKMFMNRNQLNLSTHF